MAEWVKIVRTPVGEIKLTRSPKLLPLSPKFTAKLTDLHRSALKKRQLATHRLCPFWLRPPHPDLIGYLADLVFTQQIGALSSGVICVRFHMGTEKYRGRSAKDVSLNNQTHRQQWSAAELASGAAPC